LRGVLNLRLWCSVDDFYVGVEDGCAYADGEALDAFFDFAELAVEVVSAAVNGGYAEGGAVPEGGVVEFGDGDVEAVAELVFERADGLATVLKGLRVFDGEFDRKCRDGHGCGQCRMAFL